MTRMSFFKKLIDFFTDPVTYFYSLKVKGFIEENTLLTVFICGAAILAVIIIGYITAKILDKLKL